MKQMATNYGHKAYGNFTFKGLAKLRIWFENEPSSNPDIT
jgi:hypothetical protein